MPLLNCANCRHLQPNGADRWGPGIKEMDSMEEDYFNGDEEEDIPTEPVPAEEVTPEKPFELKRRRSTDDDDDELLQLAQKSPLAKGTTTPFHTVLTAAADDSNGTKPSPSASPSSSPPSDRLLREKRPRDTDEHEDEMDRLSRSSKRVVSPTDFKRKPSRGTINGGKKIAISLGKK